MSEKLYIIDGHAHIYAAYYAPMRPLSSPSGLPTKAAYIFTNSLLGLIENKKPDMLIVAMDSKGKSFRADIYPQYKAHRPPMPEDLPVQIESIERILSAMNIPVLRIEGMEADDIIGTVAKRAAKKGIQSFICSKDKDFIQLLDENIFIYDMKKGVVTDTETIQQQMQISPGQFIDCLALQGDTADNVPGVADVGPKTAIQWIQKYHSLDNLYEHADEITGKRGENLRDSRDIAYLSKKLVTINCEIPIDVDYDAFKLTEPDMGKLVDIFTEFGFKRLVTLMGLSPSGRGEVSDIQPQHLGQQQQLSSFKSGSADYKLIDDSEMLKKFVKQLAGKKIFAIDTETTSINAMRAELVGLSFSWQKNEAFYLAVKAPLGARHLEITEVRRLIGPILADENIKKIGQNIKYDMLILKNASMPLNGVCFDTMVASYCLESDRSHSMDNMAIDYLGYECISIKDLIGKGKNQLTFDMVETESAAVYAAEDADMTWRLYEYLNEQLDSKPQIRKLFEDIEIPLVTVLADMEYSGVSIDVKLLKDMSGQLNESIERLSGKICEYAGGIFNIDSPKQLAGVLFDKLGLTSVRSGKTSRSTAADVLEQLRDQHEIVDNILEYRQLAKLQNTYVSKLGRLINPKTSRLHASFNQTITATGRLSSSNPNLQNIPIRTDIGKKIRSAFIPEKKTDCILSADYSQIELRLLAHFSGDKAMCKAFAEDADIHAFVASQIYDVDLSGVTKEMRSSCKAVNFGLIYGQGAFGLSRSTGMSIHEAKDFIEQYFKRYSSIKEFFEELINKAKSTGYAETIMHRIRHISGLNSRNGNKRSQAERLAVNTVIQGSAADLIKVAMINIQKKIDSERLPVKMILQIHDELVFELPLKEAKKHSQWISSEMAGALKLDVPLKVDVSFGPSWLNEK